MNESRRFAAVLIAIGAMAPGRGALSSPIDTPSLERPDRVDLPAPFPAGIDALADAPDTVPSAPDPADAILPAEPEPVAAQPRPLERSWRPSRASRAGALARGARAPPIAS